uniref:Uncharacterized protein n=1 Tax=Meloidogyne enterolobii TaxID=390850 RepID=A0A6V7TQ18_MELEN|nr:unnamed protein product [Meloidogyne enterolobii]
MFNRKNLKILSPISPLFDDEQIYRFVVWTFHNFVKNERGYKTVFMLSLCIFMMGRKANGGENF